MEDKLNICPAEKGERVFLEQLYILVYVYVYFIWKGTVQII